MKTTNSNREVSKSAIAAFSDIGSDILHRFAGVIEDIVSDEGEKTRIQPRHIEQALARYIRVELE